jgi:hypothetical protein
MIHAMPTCEQDITTFEASIVDRLRFGKHLLYARQMSFQQLSCTAALRQPQAVQRNWF